MLLEKDRSCLVLIDVQDKLAPLVHNSNDLLARCEWMMRLAEALHVPTLITEQYPKGLGRTVSSLVINATLLAIEKLSFSCGKNSQFNTTLAQLNRKQCVLIGIEAHVCVLQTTFDLLSQGYDVFVVVDAVSSRHSRDVDLALQRMQYQGIKLVSSEMVFFEWLETADNAMFKSLSQQFLR